MAEARRKLKLRLCESQNWHCCYCGVIVSVDSADVGSDIQATFDHVVPLAQIRYDSRFTAYQERWYHRHHYDKKHWNYNVLVIACLRCNKVRKATDAYAFYEGELWKPEHKNKLKLYHMMQQYKWHCDIGLLKAMGKYCKCEPEYDKT